jgi:hypothetical protein
MGSEATCRAELGGKAGSGTALLETDEVIFRGDFRAKVPLKSLKKVTVDGAWLVLESKDDVLRLELGSRAEAWAKRIRSPPTLLDKLGIAATTKLALLGTFDDAFQSELASRGTNPGADAGSADVLLLLAETPKALAKLAGLRKKVRSEAAVWVVFRKGKSEPGEADVLAAGRAAGFKDVKVARFSETHTALKMVVPKADR